MEMIAFYPTPLITLEISAFLQEKENLFAQVVYLDPLYLPQ